MLIKQLIRVYTPFIMAIVSAIHSTLFIVDHEGLVYNIFANSCGYSILAIAYIMATSRRMCKWYKATNWLLMSVCILNTIYLIWDFRLIILLYATNGLSLAAMIAFVIHRCKVGIKKLNDLSDKH